MKTFLVIFLLIASFAFGQTATQTPNLHLSKPALNSTNWGSYMNMNTDLLDQYLSGQLALPGSFWTSMQSPILTGNNLYTGANKHTGAETFTSLNGIPFRGQTLNTFGDSITNGQGASSAATYYVNLIGAANGWTINNPAVRGDMLFDQCKLIYGTAVTNASLSSFLIGQNDAGNATNSQDAWVSAYSACAAWLLMPNKITGQSSAATRTGAFTNSDLYPAFGTKTTTSGDTFSAPIYGSAVYLATQTTTSCSNSFSVSIDGVNMGSFSQKTPFTTTHSTSIAPQLLRFGNLQNGTHTVVVTNNSASCTLYIDWLASPQGQMNINGPFLFAATPYQTQTPATTDLIAHMVRNSIATLAQDGLGAILTDLESYCGPGTSNLCNATDGTHPNDAGEQVIANAFLNDMTVLHGYANRQMPSWLRNITNPSTSETELIESCSGIRGGIACDTFDRADNASSLGTSSSGAVWLTRGGTLGVSNHQAYGTIGGNNWSTIDAGSGDASVSVQLAVLPVLGGASQMWIPFRVQDVNSYWRLGLPTGSHTLTLQKIVAGSASGTQPTFNTVATNDIIKITALGNTLAVYVNGKLRGTYVDSTYSTATAFGIQFNDTATRVGYFALSVVSKTTIGQKPLSFNSTPDALAVPILMQAGTTADQTDVLRWADHTGAIKYNFGMFNDGSFQLVDSAGLSRMLMLSSGNRQILPTGGLWSVHDHLSNVVAKVGETGPFYAYNGFAPNSSGNQTWISGAGAPSSGSCVTTKGGSLYVRTDGTSATTFYLCDGVSGIWTPLSNSLPSTVAFNNGADALYAPITFQAGVTADQTTVMRWLDHTGAVKYNFGMFNDDSFQLVDPLGLSRLLFLTSGTRMILPTGGIFSVHDHNSVANFKVFENGSMQVGPNGSQINTILTGAATLTYTAVAAQTCQEQPITVTNSLVANKGVVASPQAEIGANLMYGGARVSAAGTIQVRVCNPTAASITPNAVAWGATVTQ